MNNEFKKMVLLLSAGIGTDYAEFYLVPVDMTQEELDDYAWEAAKQHGESYGIYPESERPEDYDEEDAEGWGSDSYSDDIEGHFEDYNPEEHDGLRVGGDTKWCKI